MKSEKPHKQVLSPTRVLNENLLGDPERRCCTFKECISSLRKAASHYRKDGIGVWSIRKCKDIVYVKRII